MKHKIKITSVFLLLTFALLSFSCANQTAQSSNNSNSSSSVSSGEKAKSPTEAYKMLYAAVKAKDSEKIKQMMTKASLGLAEFNANNQKITIEKSLENGLVAPTLSPTLTEIRDERVKDTFGAIEVFNAQTKIWEELPFILEDGGWKLAVGDIFQDKYKSPGKGQAQIEREASNTMTIMPTNKFGNMPAIPANKNSVKAPASNESKSVEVPKDKPEK